MAWYTAHLVTWFRFKEGPQDCFPVQENLVLIQAASAEEVSYQDFVVETEADLRRLIAGEEITGVTLSD
jgi:hypothetical protein